MIDGKRLFWALVAGVPWSAVLFGMASVVLPRGWGLQTWWGPYVMGLLFAIAVWGCYWAWGKHEQQLAAQGGRPVQLPNWTIKWFALALALLVGALAYYVVKTT